MHIHPNLYRNGRDAKEEAIELARLHSGYVIYPNRNRPLYITDNSTRVSQRELILIILRGRAKFKKLPKEDRDFWKEVIFELEKIPDLQMEDNSFPSKSNRNPKKNTAKFSKKLKTALIIFGILIAFFTPRIIDGLTPVNILTERIHENSKYTFSGSICNDGHISHSQGRGSCSWHGGVSSEFYKGEYSRSIDDCRAEAEKLSWRN